MVRAVRAELVKFFTTRLWWGMAIAVLLTGGVFALLFGLLLTGAFGDEAGPPGGFAATDPVTIANSVYTAGLQIGYLLLLTIGVIQIGAEYRHHTITSTFLTEPRRSKVMTAKVVALLLVGALYGVISLAGSVAVGAITLSSRGAEAFPSSDVLRTLALSLLVLGLWALIGLGVGILIPNQVAALLIGVGVAWVVEPILGLVLRTFELGREQIAPYLPSAATAAIVDTVQQPGEVRLDWWAGALVLMVWAGVLAGLGALLTARRDIS